LVLIKSVLEAIPIYWQTLAHIPKGILEKNRKFCFNFPWQGSNDYKRNHLVKWQRIATLKSSRGWGMKNIHLFGKSLATK
jgi:hypothetical protein